MKQMTRYDKRIRVTLMLLVCLFFMVVILSIVEFKKGTYVPEFHQLMLDKEWILALIAVIGLYISMWLIHDFQKEHKEKKQSAHRRRYLALHPESDEIFEKIKKDNNE